MSVKRFKKSSKKTSVNGIISASSIPSFQSDQVQTLVIRYFVNPASASDTVTFVRELPIVPNAISASATAMYQIYKAVRLIKMEAWCNYRPSVSIEGNTINVTCVERRLVRPVEWSATASSAVNAHIKKKFSIYDPLGQWYSTATGESNPELRFLLNKGAVLELTFAVVLHDSESVTTVSGAGLTFPRVYTNSLDTNVLCIGKGFATVINT